MKAQVLVAALILAAQASMQPGAPACEQPESWQQAQNGPSPDKEGTGSGSGSTGMAPQQGTGSGATQQAPTANQTETGKGPAPAPDSPDNQSYGRETAPSGQPMQNSNPDKNKSP